MDAYESQAKLLKMLANPARLQILDILRAGEQCVCHLEAVLGLRQPYVSQQLMVLRKAGLVTDRKDGVRVFYKVPDANVYTLLDTALNLLSRQAQKQGRLFSLTDLHKAKPRACHCPKCAQVSPAFVP
jgi:ArsR family transcriptional regulator